MFQKKCVLMQPNKFLAPPLGLLAIGSILEKHNYEVKILEIEESDDFLENNSSGFFDKIDANLIGLSFFSSQSKRAESIIRALKKAKKDVIIICGGIHPSCAPEEVLGMGADYVVVGEGEETVIELFNAIEKQSSVNDIDGIVFKAANGKYFKTSSRAMIKDLSSLPITSYHLLDSRRFKKRNYFIRGLWLRCGHILTSRGCPSNCNFCAATRFGGRIVRERNIDDIIDELKILVKEYGIEGFWIVDDTFVLKKKRVEEFCAKLKRLPYKFKWACNSRVDTLTEDMVINLKDSGCIQLEFGVESGSQRVLDALNKGIKIEQIEKAFEYCRRHKMRTLANIMIGNPEEKMEDVEKTAQIIKKIRPSYVNYSFLVPFPGTYIYDVAIRNGWINKNVNFNTTVTEDPIMLINFTKNELVGILNNFYKKDNVVRDYLIQPIFLLDMVKFSLMNPLKLFKILQLLVWGRKMEARNLFSKVYL